MKSISKKMVCTLISFLAIPLMVVGFLTEFWSLGSTGSTSQNTNYKLFDEIPQWFIDSFNFSSNNYQGIWRLLLLIAVVFATVVLAVYLVFAIVDLFSSNKNTKLVKKFSSYALLVSSVLVLIFALLFMNLNVFTITGVSQSIKFMPEQGFYAMVLAPAVAGLFGLLSTIKENKSKKKGKSKGKRK